MDRYTAQFSNGQSLNIEAANRQAALAAAKAHLRTFPRTVTLTELYHEDFWAFGA